MKEIGGYFELELRDAGEFYADAIHLNSDRNGIRYIVRAYRINTIYAPAFTCPVVWDALRDEGCEIRFYNVGEDFFPLQIQEHNAWVLYTNYFGICDKQVNKMRQCYPNLIVDQAQAFYAPPTELCVYSPRKFFGLPDGGLLYTQKKLYGDLPEGVSFHRMSHLLRRLDEGGSAGYSDFCENDATLNHEPITQMSRLTQHLLRNIQYQLVAECRQKNFAYLHKFLKDSNEILFEPGSFTAPMVYPYLNRSFGSDWKKRLIEQQIFVATYWRGQQDPGWGEVLTQNMLALPIDQRYGIKEMQRILEVLL